jgi:hypothetical protein
VITDSGGRERRIFRSRRRDALIWGTDLAPLARFARFHHQLITRTAAAELGMRKSAWYRALDSPRFEQIHPGVARVAGVPVTPAR